MSKNKKSVKKATVAAPVQPVKQVKPVKKTDKTFLYISIAAAIVCFGLGIRVGALLF